MGFRFHQRRKQIFRGISRLPEGTLTGVRYWFGMNGRLLSDWELIMPTIPTVVPPKKVDYVLAKMYLFADLVRDNGIPAASARYLLGARKRDRDEDGKYPYPFPDTHPAQLANPWYSGNVVRLDQTLEIYHDQKH